MSVAQRKTKNTETISIFKRRPWGTKFIEVVNDSNYALKLTHVHEDKAQLKRKEIIIERGANASAGAGVGLDNLVEGKMGLRFSHKQVENMSFEGGKSIVDDRTLSKGEYCKVHFPRDCKELRVRGFYVLPIKNLENPLVVWKNSVYGRSVRITATMKEDLSMGDPKVVDVGLVEQLPFRSLLVAGGVMFSVAAYFIVPVVR